MRKFLSLFAVLVFLSTLAFSQVKVITGRITDAQGQPVPYSTVKIKGSKQGVAADADGNYSIKASAGQTLVISGTGLNSKEAVIGASSNVLDFVITRKEGSLTEVVVTAQGIRKEAKALGYSAATVSGEQLNVSKPINVAQGLIGQVSGAQISIINNGVDPQIRIQFRGERHINYDNQALVVIDGMQIPGSQAATSIAQINPEDIESSTVLKGASAASLYGSQATNGVLIITTRRGGKGGKPVINVNQTVTMEREAYFPALQTTYSGYGGEQGTFFSGTAYQFQAVNPYTGFTNYIPFENQSYGPAYNNNPALGYIGSPDANGNVYKTPFTANTDPRKDFFVTGITSQSDASISTGDNKNSNFLSLQYVNVKGTTPKDQSYRANIRFAGKRTYGIFSYDYTLGYTLKYTNTVGNDFTGQPVYWSLLNTQANVPINSLKDWWDPNSPGNASNYYNAYYANPWWAIDNSRLINKTDALQGVLALNLKATDWLTGTYRISAQVNNNVYEGYRNLVQFSSYSKSDPWGEGNYESGGNVPGAITNITTLNRNLQQDILLTFHKNIAGIDATLILGNTITDAYLNQQTQSNGNLYLPALYNIAFSTGISQIGAPFTSSVGAQGYTDSRLIGSFADLQLSYHDILFLHGAYRHDQSSLLAAGHNGYDVYSVDGSYVFSDNISALKNSSWFSFGKIRAAYSQTGQITLAPYATVNTFNVSGGYPYGSLASLSISGTYNNPSLTPEQTNEKEAGVEFGFLKNRITGGITYYYDDNLKQLFPVSLTTATGFTNANVNAARTVSDGWEFDLNGTVVKTSSFKWDVRTNLAIQTTTVKSLYGGAQYFPIANSNEAIVGYSFPQMFVQDLNRDPQGHIIVDGTTGLPSLNNTYEPVGRTTPKYILGLTSSFTYKNLSLQIIGDYRGGYVFYNNAELNLDFTGASAHTAENGRQNFIYPNSVIQTAPGKYTKNTSVYTQDGNIGFWAYSAFRKAGASYVENASAWKVRTINISYDFTSLFKSMTYVHGVKLTLLCNNVLMFRPKENDFTDPEFNYSNNNGYGYNTIYQLPPTRQFTAVLSLKF